MRIGIDARLWNETGVGRYIRNLVWNLQDLDKVNSYVLFIKKGIKNHIPPGTSELGIDNKNWKIVETDIRWHTIEEQRLLPKILEKEQLDLVHFPYFSVPIYYKGPFVITIHDLIIHHFPTGKASTLPSPIYYLKRYGYKYVIKAAAQKAQKVITVSQATKDEIIKHLHVPEDKVIVTYEGIEDSSKFPHKGDPSDKMQNAKLPFKMQNYFLYVGNAYPHKNLERLIDAFKLIVDEFPEVKLVLIGKDDFFHQQLKEKVKRSDIEKNVIFSGFVSEEELQAYYQNARATILPSLMEGFGLTGLEAMRNGCLVIASDIPSLKEIYKDAALYFDPLAIGSLHATIREVLTGKKSVHQYIVNGKKRIGFFSWEKMAEKTLKIYESSTSSSSV